MLPNKEDANRCKSEQDSTFVAPFQKSSNTDGCKSEQDSTFVSTFWQPYECKSEQDNIRVGEPPVRQETSDAEHPLGVADDHQAALQEAHPTIEDATVEKVLQEESEDMRPNRKFV